MSIVAMKRRKGSDDENASDSLVHSTGSHDDSRLELEVLLPEACGRGRRLQLFALVLMGVTALVSFPMGFLMGQCWKYGGPHPFTTPVPSRSRFDTTKYIIENINKENIKRNLEDYSSAPRLTGTDLDRQLGERIFAQWKSFGLDDVHLATYDILLSLPNKTNPNKVQIVDKEGRVEFSSALYEKPLRAEDNHQGVVPPYNAYAPAGTVQGDLVFVNYGRLEDFDLVTKERGLSLQGKICIARYGKIFRGDKAQMARDRGAVGLILYNDPADYLPDNTSHPYPHSWWLPPSGLERGSLRLEGDLQTPLYPSTDYAYRIPLGTLKSLPDIPVHPVSYEDAEKLLRLMQGPKAPKHWQGGFHFTYRLGPGFHSKKLMARLEVNNILEVKKVYNVIAHIHGDLEPDRYVMMGNHHDAWTYGAVDPLSGSAALTEIARLFGEMLRQGQRPRRSLILCSWDGEEQGLLGSMEFVEENLKVLQERAVAYLNVDFAVGFPYTLQAGLSPLLQDPVYQAAKKIPSPEDDGRSLYDLWRSRPKNSSTPVPEEPQVSYALGSGSDMAAFYQRAGVPCLDMWFDYDSAKYPMLYYPTYHSAYETFFMYSNFVDPKFNYTLTIARLWAVLASDLANADLLGLNVRRYAKACEVFFQRLLQDFGKFWVKHSVNTDGLQSAVKNLTDSAEKFASHLENLDQSTMTSLELRILNDKLIQFERAFLDPQGLPGRPRYKHVIFAPSRRDSYSESQFPGVVDAANDLLSGESKDWSLLKQQISVATYVVQSAANTLKDISL